jgi:hypothetical protein
MKLDRKNPDFCWVMYCYSTFLFHYYSYSYYHYITPTAVWWCIVILLLHHRDCCRVIYCYSTFLFHYYYYYITPTIVGWCIAILRFFFTIITSPRTQSGDLLLFYVSFSLFLLLLLLFFHTFCPLDFSEMPWSNFMKPCRNSICHVKLCEKWKCESNIN